MQKTIMSHLNKSSDLRQDNFFLSKWWKKTAFWKETYRDEWVKGTSLIGRDLKILPRQESLLLSGQSLIQSLLDFWSASSVCLLTKKARVLWVRHSYVF